MLTAERQAAPNRWPGESERNEFEEQCENFDENKFNRINWLVCFLAKIS